MYSLNKKSQVGDSIKSPVFDFSSAIRKKLSEREEGPMQKYSDSFQNSIELLRPLAGQNAPEGHAIDQNDTISMYNNVIRQYMRRGRVQEAKALLMNMGHLGLKPNVLSFNLVMNSCAATGDTVRAGQLLDCMRALNISPNEVTYATICKVLAFNGQVAQIQEFLRLLKKNNIQLNVYFFGALISACGRCVPRDANTAARAFNEMVALGLRPQSVKKALARAVGVGRASAMISHACRTTVETQPSYESYESEKENLYMSEKGTAHWGYVAPSFTGYAATPLVRMSV
eukprot:CAMPEP_0170594928 /NCGR_PEP_ID=MMETSP0224-20130122/14270_1 /TAXON_ID=285029 /ORGANISM="Togula jolla, Strain CCCM 725" /LENGTH=285 /DNA_ID=CAMNT_0010919035 /DNA_START=100 /DNA_END=957 /DNA_ORIENTATION=-